MSLYISTLSPNLPLDSQTYHSLEDWVFAAKNGDAEAQYKVGKMYMRGAKGVVKNDRKAAEFLLRAVSQLHEKAHLYLGLLYAHGLGVEQSYEKARHLFEYAAARNLGEACYHLGLMYEEALGVHVDQQRVMAYINQAANLNHAEAIDFLGRKYEAGEGGLPYCPHKALIMYNQAANLGFTSSFNSIGIMYEKGLLGLPDQTTAFSYYLRAADLGSAEACYNVACLYKTGTVDIKRNLKLAAEYFTKAINGGYLEAHFWLGELYDEDAQSSKTLDSEAKNWLRQAFYHYSQAAIHLNDAEAWYNIGLMYAQGTGVNASIEQAIECLEQALKLGHHPAGCFLEKIYLKRSPARIEMSSTCEIERYIMALPTIDKSSLRPTRSHSI